MPTTNRSDFSIPLAAEVDVAVDHRESDRVRLLAFHGYAENPDKVLAALAGLSGVSMVAPWGPHQFYNRQGEVIASWMTRRKREAQIERLLPWMGRVWESASERHGELPLALFGFSQGAAMAYRVGVLGRLPVRVIFCLAGDMPPEVIAALPTIDPVPIHLLVGEGDSRVPLGVLEKDRDTLVEHGWNVTLHRLRGGHEISTEAVAVVQKVLDETFPP